MKRQLVAVLLSVGSLLFAFNAVAMGQAAVAREAIEEGTQLVLDAIGRQGAKDLAKVGGEAAVRDVLKKAGREGGESLVKKAAQYCAMYGTRAVGVIDRDPAAMVDALDHVAPDLRVAVLDTVEDDPKLAMKLLSKYGPKSLEAAARHPGVGTGLIQELGEEGLRADEVLDTDGTIKLARHAQEISALPPAQRQEFWSVFRAAPVRVVDYIERHPGVLAVGGVYALRREILGVPGSPSGGLIDRTRDSLLRMFSTPISVTLFVVAAAIALWTLLHVWKTVIRIRAFGHSPTGPPASLGRQGGSPLGW